AEPPTHSSPRRAGVTAYPRRPSSATVWWTRSDVVVVWGAGNRATAAPPGSTDAVNGNTDRGYVVLIVSCNAGPSNQESSMTADGHFRVPTPVNEPVRAYAPGDPHRKSLKSRLAELTDAR